MDKTSSDRKVPPEIAEAVRIARVTKRLSQESLAASAGVSRKIISGFESGGDIRVSALASIAKAVGLQVRITSEAA